MREAVNWPVESKQLLLGEHAVGARDNLNTIVLLTDPMFQIKNAASTTRHVKVISSPLQADLSTKSDVNT